MQFKLARWDFKFSIVTSGAYFLVMMLLLNLGFWQVRRAEEKRVFIEKQQTQLKTVLNLNTQTTDDLESLRYRQITANGFYDKDTQFLIDNQIIKGKAGYFIITPFVLAGGTKAVLVNRGWLPANPDRTILPAISFIENQTQINGRINSFPSVGLKLEGAEIPTEGWPSVVQVVESSVLAKKLGYDLFSFQVELDPKATAGYTRNWLESSIMPPEKHIGYAVQWFGLAITLTILFFWHSGKKRIDD
ncbi:MAG: SURF1 family protein [Methylococcaceae bacterium]|nr:SURF1 family protein [Methylococcaceae bacterium]